MASQGVFQHCKDCRLAWLARGDFDAAVRDVERSYRPDDLETLKTECRERQQALAARAFEEGFQVRYHDCPECGERMHRRAFASETGIILNVCTSHGLVMSDDDLRLALDFVRRGGEVVMLVGQVESLKAQVAKASDRQRDAEERADASASMDFFIM